MFVDETYADAVDADFCDVGGDAFVAGVYGTLLIGTALFEAIADPQVISLVLPSDWGGYSGSPMQINDSLDCSGNNSGRDSCPPVMPRGPRFFDLLDDGVDAV